jgi:uncharacterized membrane protein YesL
LSPPGGPARRGAASWPARPGLPLGPALGAPPGDLSGTATVVEALRYLRSALGEYVSDLPRMALLNLFWFITALPLLFTLAVAYAVVQSARALPWTALILNVVVQVTLPLVVSLALAGPGTAATYHVTNRLVNGELLEPSRFWRAFRRYFWPAWRLALVDVGAAALLAINIYFYWTIDRPGVWLLSTVFIYLMVLWFAIQSYLFALLVEMKQPVRLVIRNALFMAIDQPGLTLGLTFANGVLLAVTANPATAAVLVPLAAMAIASTMNNRAVVEAIQRYRAAGRIIAGDDRTTE